MKCLQNSSPMNRRVRFQYTVVYICRVVYDCASNFKGGGVASRDAHISRDSRYFTSVNWVTRQNSKL